MVPKKIVYYARERQRNVDKCEDITEIELMCCQKNSFLIEFKGKTKGLIRQRIIPESESLNLEAVCSNCNKRVVVFDYEKDGYDMQTKDYLQNEDNQKMEKDNLGLNKYFCPKCRSVVFSVEVKYEYPDLDELKKLDLMDYSNAYTWICVSLKCCGCGKKIEGIIDLETG